MRCLPQGYDAKVNVNPRGFARSWLNPNTHAHSPAAANLDRRVTGEDAARSEQQGFEPPLRCGVKRAFHQHKIMTV